MSRVKLGGIGIIGMFAILVPMIFLVGGGTEDGRPPTETIGAYFVEDYAEFRAAQFEPSVSNSS